MDLRLWIFDWASGKSGGRRLLVVLWLLLVLRPRETTAQVVYDVVVDRHASALAGSETLVAAQRAGYALTDRLLPHRLWREDTDGRRFLGAVYRFTKMALAEDVVDHMASLVQHEVFGHGARVREFGWVTERYRLSPVPPYGSGSGWISYDLPRGEVPSRYEDVTLHIAGMNAQALLAADVRERALRRGRLHYREASLYMMSFNATIQYVLRTAYSLYPSGNDVLNFLGGMDGLACDRGACPGGDRDERLGRLKRRVLIGFLDPYNALAFYSLLTRNLVGAEPTFDLPSLTVRGARYLPSVRLGFAPFGSEFILENLFARRGRLLNVYGRFGTGPVGPFWGGGADAQGFYRRGALAVDLRLDLWQQPPLTLDPAARIRPGARPGGRLLATLSHPLQGTGRRLAALCTLGYKTRGFLPGGRLAAGPVFRLGLRVQE